MPGLSGFEASRRLRHEVPKAKNLVMSQHEPIQLLPRAVEAGAHACQDKSHLGTELLSTIKTIEGISEACRPAGAG
jgi:DNA-binding NarL/FixJ family response regulator